MLCLSCYEWPRRIGPNMNATSGTTWHHALSLPVIVIVIVNLCSQQARPVFRRPGQCKEDISSVSLSLISSIDLVS